jgi:hypothetical protein
MAARRSLAKPAVLHFEVRLARAALIRLGGTLATSSSASIVGWTSMATGVVGLFALLFIVLLYTVGGPFGTLNDLANGLLAILTGILAVLFYVQARAQSPLLSLGALILALIGALAVPLGSALVISGRTGWFRAALYASAGFGAIGLWLVWLNVSALHSLAWSHSLAVAGIVIGAVMALGLAVLPGLFTASPAWDSAPWELAPWYVSYVGVAAGSLGWLVLYPIWCVLLGRAYLVS